MNDLIQGKETETCHVATDANEQQVTTIAERAQDLPLTFLAP
jgi:hypothetical protein